MEGSSSSNIGNPYPYPSHVTMKLSGRDTYDVWKTQMLCLFESHDMLRFIQLKTLDGYNEDLWKRSDALVKGWILGSLSDQTLKSVVNSFPNKVFTTKDAWDNLQTLYDPVFRADHDRDLEERPMRRVVSMIDEAEKQKIEEAKNEAQAKKEAQAKQEAERKEAEKSRSAEKLHAAILDQDISDVKDILDDRIVTLRDKITINGNTALHVAVGTSSNNKEFFEKMLNLATKDNQPSLDMRNSEGSTLLHVVAVVGNTEAAKMLVGRNRDLFEILVNAIYTKDYGRMMHLFSHFPVTFKFVEAAQRKAQAYVDAKYLVRITCRLIRESTATSTTYKNAIFEATRQNVVMVVKITVSQFPNAIWTRNEDGHNIIQYAVINRSEKVYNLLYQMSEHKNIYRTIKDPYENNLLHLAARLAPKNKLNPISGAALQIQRELQWFKEVERFVCPLNVIEKNSYGKTPQKVFAKEHKKLAIEGEKWMKETAQLYTITAALITTIVFVAAITVPGGNKQENGIPVFTNNADFYVFAVSDAISFFTSVTSLLMFLSILTARFSEQDFLFKLPTQLIVGLANLFISTTAMLVAFGATLFLVFSQNNSWILVPIAALTCLPITSFVTLQFPLVYDLIRATYGRSMFGKKSNAPFY
ncbi:hypothetical protein E3N88_09599 [Mikania micrantha]|uniref:PGG domain-containing protein n=1 Tax=Mikania micrantha TaxID=192012 RepID=A0A5N6PLS9_9ASTR|nr:hypothetical protein E3N88_09599 [Mikania micrantha]